MSDENQFSPNTFKKFLIEFQERLCNSIQQQETGDTVFLRDSWARDNPAEGGGISCVLEGGETIERGGVNFSHIKGDSLPSAATAKRQELVGRGFEAMGVSVVIHPRNPYAPTAHMNVRLFIATRDGEDPIWWFGGGLDLTPFYPVEEDVLLWHRQAKKACDEYAENYYADFKKWCDEYFYLKHRNETRGVGGLFFDDLNELGFEKTQAFTQAVADTFEQTYPAIIAKRKDTPYTEREREFQLYRRGRYVEFNLVYDRGTLFGLQSGGRTESILMSFPSEVHWKYNWHPMPGTPEAALYDRYLKPQDWLAD